MKAAACIFANVRRYGIARFFPSYHLFASQ